MVLVMEKLFIILKARNESMQIKNTAINLSKQVRKEQISVIELVMKYL